jgi:hypothetical protein
LQQEAAMDKTLSVLFNTDRVYAGLFERSEKGLRILDINSTKGLIDIQDIDSTPAQKAIDELHAIIEEFGEFDRIGISFPTDYAIASHIPGNANIPHDELLQLIILEVQQLFPHAKISDFIINCYPVNKDKSGVENMFVNLLAKDDIENCKTIFEKYDKPIEKIETVTLSAQQAMLYNYPDNANNTTVIAGIQNNFIDFLVFQWQNILYSNLVSFSSEDEIPEILSKEFATIKERYADNIDGIYFYGSDLIKSTNMSCWESAMMEGLESKRLNSFRMTHNSLTPRQKKYAAKVFHLYAGVVGAALPDNPYKILI